MVSPFIAMALVKVGRPEGISTKSLKIVGVGGGPLSADQVTAVRDTLPGTNVFLGYGLTETAGCGCMFTMAAKSMLLSYKNPSSCGQPLPGYTYKVRNFFKTLEVIYNYELNGILIFLDSPLHLLSLVTKWATSTSMSLCLSYL